MAQLFCSQQEFKGETDDNARFQIDADHEILNVIQGLSDALYGQDWVIRVKMIVEHTGQYKHLAVIAMSRLENILEWQDLH